ncbi:hypothetical protein SLEP1_g5062 [Rubroshorea leprosula]|uniref:Uncharacterized protein n=1 Tax=Rubroshorea leprosula TaxID=152421 RepID=A0AAV5HV41_9ROSI|nr:hypothetical protein SLEP1_g5062 [Rubroshorea leprosula]
MAVILTSFSPPTQHVTTPPLLPFSSACVLSTRRTQQPVISPGIPIMLMNLIDYEEDNLVRAS